MSLISKTAVSDMKKISIITVLLIFIMTPALATNQMAIAVQHADLLFYSKVLLVVIIACVGILALRAFRNSDETN